jgi:hypothetical protein
MDRIPHGGVSSSILAVTSMMMMVLGRNLGVWVSPGGLIGLGCGRDDGGSLAIDPKVSLQVRRQIGRRWRPGRVRRAWPLFLR